MRTGNNYSSQSMNKPPQGNIWNQLQQHVQYPSTNNLNEHYFSPPPPPPSYPPQFYQYPQPQPHQPQFSPQMLYTQPKKRPPQPIISSDYQNNQNQIFHVQFTPSCMEKLLMLPFPFLCVGCCIWRTSILTFNCKTRMAKIRTYCGYCVCCAEQVNASFDQIRKLSLVQANMTINKRSAYYLVIEVKDRRIQLTGGKLMSEIEPLRKQLGDKMKKCRINFQQDIVDL